MIQHEAQCILRLVQFLPLHGARRIQHADHVFGDHIPGLHLHLWGYQQQEEPILLRGLIAEEAQPHLFLSHGVIQGEIGVGLRVTGLIADPGVVIIFSIHSHLMAGGVDGLERGRRLHLHTDRYLFQWTGGELLGVEGIDVAHQALIHGQDLLVLDLDPPLAVRGDGEDAGLKCVPANVLQQGRVLALADDLLVDAAGLIPIQHLPLQPLAIHPHVEAGDGCLLGQGEDIGALHGEIRLVEEDLIHASGSHLVGDCHLHAVILDRQFRPHSGKMGWWFGDDDAVGPGGGRGNQRHQNGHQKKQTRHSLEHLNLLSTFKTLQVVRRFHCTGNAGFCSGVSDQPLSDLLEFSLARDQAIPFKVVLFHFIRKLIGQLLNATLSLKLRKAHAIFSLQSLQRFVYLLQPIFKRVTQRRQQGQIDLWLPSQFD